MMLLVLASLRAWAVEPPPLNAQLFHTSIDGRTGLSLDDAVVAPDGRWNARALLQYVNDPLVFVTTQGDELGGLEDVVALNLLGGYTWRALRVGVDLPVYPWVGGALVDGGGAGGRPRGGCTLHAAGPRCRAGRRRSDGAPGVADRR